MPARGPAQLAAAYGAAKTKLFPHQRQVTRDIHRAIISSIAGKKERFRQGLPPRRCRRASSSLGKSKYPGHRPEAMTRIEAAPLRPSNLVHDTMPGRSLRFPLKLLAACRPPAFLVTSWRGCSNFSGTTSGPGCLSKGANRMATGRNSRPRLSNAEGHASC